MACMDHKGLLTVHKDLLMDLMGHQEDYHIARLVLPAPMDILKALMDVLKDLTAPMAILKDLLAPMDILKDLLVPMDLLAPMELLTDLLAHRTAKHLVTCLLTITCMGHMDRGCTQGCIQECTLACNTDPKGCHPQGQWDLMAILHKCLACLLQDMDLMVRHLMEACAWDLRWALAVIPLI
jgi:hypothetical protein